MSQDLAGLEEMAARLKWPARKRADGRSSRAEKLRDYLHVRSRQLGVSLLHPWGEGTGKGRRYKASEAQLREHCPELFGQTLDEVKASFEAHLRSIDTKIETRLQAKIEEVIDPQLAELRDTGQRVQLRVDETERRLETMAADLLRVAERLDALAG